MKSRYTNVKYCEISRYFSVHCLPQSLRNYKEEAKIKPSEKALAYIHIELWDVITHPFNNFNGGLTKSQRSYGMYKYM